MWCVKIEFMEDLQAPLQAGDTVGQAVYESDGKVLGTMDIVAKTSVDAAGFVDYVKKVFGGYGL